MSTTKHPFNAAIFAGLVLAAGILSWGSAQAELSEMKKNETGLYKNVFDQSAFYEGTTYLRLDRLSRALFGKKVRAKDANVFDEVPDSSFFTNRHGRNPLSAGELERGYAENEGPDLSGKLTIIKGRFDNVNPTLRVKDGRGDEYLLKFDPADNLEMSTSSEIIGNRFYYAIGYHVPQETIISFPPDKLVPDQNTEIVDNTGFTKKLTKEKLEELLLFIPWDSDGKFRASAAKVLSGEDKGFMPLTGRRKKDPEDTVPHQDRRSIRALQVFSSWLNNFDIREENTSDMLVTDKDGKARIRHYLTAFGSSLGADRNGPKPPSFGHEYTYDAGEVTKAFAALGFWEKPWQRRWREAGEKPQDSPALGYFDNRYFKPEKFKTQLPYYAFKDLTRADGFWAAKIIMSFSDEDIKALVKPGLLSAPEDEDYLFKMLSERRDMIGRYWFQKASALDAFEVSGNKLIFEDLAVKHGLADPKDTSYQVEVKTKEGKTLASLEVREPSLRLEPAWLSSDEGFNVWIRTKRGVKAKPDPYVLAELRKTSVTGVLHQD